MKHVFALLTFVATLTGCAGLQSAKEPAQELWYAAELLCQADLTQYAAVQNINGAAAIIDSICSSVEVARPYVEVLLREQTRWADPMAWPRSNAIVAFRAQVGR